MAGLGSLRRQMDSPARCTSLSNSPPKPGSKAFSSCDDFWSPKSKMRWQTIKTEVAAAPESLQSLQENARTYAQSQCRDVLGKWMSMKSGTSFTTKHSVLPRALQAKKVCSGVRDGMRKKEQDEVRQAGSTEALLWSFIFGGQWRMSNKMLCQRNPSFSFLGERPSRAEACAECLARAVLQAAGGPTSSTTSA